jgi:hypothetical protein
MINWERIFDDTVGIDREATLDHVRDVVIHTEWTDILWDIFDSMLWEQQEPEGFAFCFGVTIERGKDLYNYGYRTLKRLAREGKIKSIMAVKK